MSMSKTTNGAKCHDHSGNHAVEFFSKAGSLKDTRDIKDRSTQALELFKSVWYSGNKELAMKLLLWVRDIRSGASNRSAFRKCIKWLAENDQEWLKANLFQIPTYGRWDDLRELFGGSCETEAAALWATAIIEQNVLAAKWADRKDRHILNCLRATNGIKNEAAFRKLLSSIRKEHIVEAKMCAREWDKIDFSKVPSVAIGKYTKSFMKNAKAAFELYKSKLEKGEAKINAGALFPHDCVKLIKKGDIAIANAQFKALPNFIKSKDGKDNKALVLVDTSGSMRWPQSKVGNDLYAYDVATSLALYCSDRMPKDSPFHKKFMQFRSEGTLHDWSDRSFSEVYRPGNKRPILTGAAGNTNIASALETILNFGKLLKVPAEYMPNMLIIISDMQFDRCVTINKRTPIVQDQLSLWTEAGYNMPKVVFWHVTGHKGVPAKENDHGVALVSGFSPSILASIFDADDSAFTPMNIMLKTLEKYNIVVPE